ncbi:sensor histidine kinase [Amycolatopsis thermoflava]|uniref:sensor histidine kinase n=1 Tax=Amycolatopsis thermoflava TaxID=84480 RepID=UPI003D7366B2
MRAHPMVGDVLLAVLLLLVDLLFLVARAAPGEGQRWYVAIPLDLAMVGPVAFRRKYPVVTAYVILLMTVPHSALELGVGSATASCVALYTVVVYVGRRQAALYLAAQAVISVVQMWAGWSPQGWAPLLFIGLIFALCWVLGEFVGARRAYHAEMEARLHLLETERDQAGRIAVAEERGRIARELHDVVAHAVSVIVVQADGASYALRSSPELAERAVRTISETGRQALTELRRLLQVLRDEEVAGEPRIPQPTAESLADLAERVRTAGVPVELSVEGSLAELPAGVSLGVYRIVQESLTNTLKHAGQGARAEVRVRRTENLVDVEIVDDGAGKARELVPGPDLPGGNGVIGMRERAHLFGGILQVGPRPGGGWRVHASFPARLDP